MGKLKGGILRLIRNKIKNAAIRKNRNLKKVDKRFVPSTLINC